VAGILCLRAAGQFLLADAGHLQVFFSTYNGRIKDALLRRFLCTDYLLKELDREISLDIGA
jgi:hypothetical protein